MNENIYDDVNHTEELKFTEHSTVNFFANADARYFNTTTETENGKTMRSPQVQQTDAVYYNTNTEGGNGRTMRNPQVQQTVTGINSTWKRCYIVTAVCVVLLLCAFLLTAIAVLWIKLNNLHTENKQLQTSYNNQAIEKYQLQTSYNNLTIASYQLQKQKDSFQNKLTNMGWVSFQSTLYYISTEKKNWSESRKDCQGRGADLVIINSKEEETFVETNNKKKHGAYIGLSDIEIEGVDKWVDGTLLTTAYWATGNQFSNLDDCVVAGLNGSVGWFDRPCTELYYWICE